MSKKSRRIFGREVVETTVRPTVFYREETSREKAQRYVDENGKGLETLPGMISYVSASMMGHTPTLLSLEVKVLDGNAAIFFNDDRAIDARVSEIVEALAKAPVDTRYSRGHQIEGAPIYNQLIGRKVTLYYETGAKEPIAISSASYRPPVALPKRKAA